MEEKAFCDIHGCKMVQVPCSMYVYCPECENEKQNIIYNFDNLHVEIDNDATEHKIDPFEALEIWQLGLELWEKRRHRLLFGSIKDKNNENKEQSFNVYFNEFGDLFSLSEKEFTLGPKESKKIKINFKDKNQEVEVYSGKLIVETNSLKQEIPFLL